MAIKPLPPRNPSAAESERYRKDMQNFNSNPDGWGRSDTRQSLQRKLKRETIHIQTGSK